MEFKAEPGSVRPGQPVTLTWATENPMGTTIEPGIGRVTPRGAIQVNPKATTTYTLAVRGPNNQDLTQSITVNVAGTVPATESGSSRDTKMEVPRTANGHPDFSGVYDMSFGMPGGRGGTRGPAAETPELKPGAEKFKIVRGPTDTGQTSDCMPLAGPQAFSEPYQFQIIESAHQLAILYGYPGTFRIIPTEGVHPKDPDPTWMGDSIGHWEGDTLVVDTVGFNDKTFILGYNHTEALHMVERFSRPDYNRLQYQATMEDPNVFAKPWVINRTYPLRPDLAKVDEFVCEHNPDYTKFFEKK